MAAFPRRARLCRPDEFKRTFETGRRHSAGLFSVVASANTCGFPRLGLAVAKKSVPLSVSRNRIKRAVRESFRSHQTKFPAVDLVVLCRPGAAKISAAEVRLTLERLWIRIGDTCAP